ncbi:MAG: ATPase domain-containing protein [Candidatus Nezhaarchaeales archaeon]
MPQTGRCETGIEGFDEVTGGGFIEGSLNILAGNPGTGKTIFAAQFVYHGAKNLGEPSIYMSFSENKRTFYRNAVALGMNFKDIEEKGLFKFIDAFTSISKEGSIELIEYALELIASMKAKRLVIDSITPIIMLLSKEEARALYHNVISKAVKAFNTTTLLILDIPLGKQGISYGVEEFIADSLIILEIQRVKDLMKRVMKIWKMRGVPISNYEYEFVVTEHGVDLYTPIPQALAGSIGERKLTTGIPGLDEMFEGGINEKSTTLVTGPSGTGKTRLSLTYVIEGVRQGEKALYISNEESEDQLRFLIKSMGYNPKELEEKGLTLRSIAPMLYTPGQWFNIVKSLIKRVNPNRVVIDGLSALERCYTKDDFLNLSRNISLLCKKLGVTLLMTHIKDAWSGEISDISTAVDNLIALWVDKRDGTLHRYITVLKSRGSQHHMDARRMNIREGKIEIKR